MLVEVGVVVDVGVFVGVNVAVTVGLAVIVDEGRGVGEDKKALLKISPYPVTPIPIHIMNPRVTPKKPIWKIRIISCLYRYQ